MLPSLQRARAADNVHESVHKRVFAMLLLLVSQVFYLPRRRLSLPAVALEPKREEERSQRRVCFADRIARLRPMLLDWRSTYTDAGTATMVAVVSESAWQLAVHAWSRSLHLTLALGVGRGTALTVLGIIVGTQVVSCATLMLPSLYNRVGSVIPSAALVTTLWFETLVFGDLQDRAAQARGACLTATALMLAIFRFDRHARNTRDQLPTSGVLLGIEAAVRSMCTRVRTGLVLPPLAAGLLLWATGWNAFWRSSGVRYEYERARFHTSLSAAALCMLLSGQDSKAHIVIGDRLERLYDFCMCHKENLLGEGLSARRNRHLGAKKSL